MKLRTLLCALVALSLLPLVAGCFKQYPGDPVPDPKAERKLPDGNVPAPRTRPAERGDGR